MRLAATRRRGIVLVAAVLALAAALLAPASAEASRYLPRVVEPVTAPQASPEDLAGGAADHPPHPALTNADRIDLVDLAAGARLEAQRLRLAGGALALAYDTGTWRTTLLHDWRRTVEDGPILAYDDSQGESSARTRLFQGLWTDPVTGLSYARARWYDARNASWLSEDPLLDVDSPNLYAFVGWGPHVATDPMGLQGRGRRALTAVEEAFRVAGRAIRNLKFKERSISTEILRHESGVSHDVLSALDRRFPGLEVPFNDKGYVEFERANYRVVFGEVSLGSFAGNSKADRAKAWSEYKRLNELTDEQVAALRQQYRMHHDYNEGRMLLVDKQVHEAYQHTGGNALAKAKTLATTVVTTVAAVLLPRTTEALQEDTSLADKATALGTDVAMNTELGWVEVPQAVEDTGQAVSEGLWDHFEDWLDGLGGSRDKKREALEELQRADRERPGDAE